MKPQKYSTLFLAIMSLTAVVSVIWCIWGVSSQRGLTTITTVCIAVILMEIFSGLIDTINWHKMIYFGFSILLCTLCLKINGITNPSSFASLHSIFSDDTVPIALLAFSILCFLFIGIRLFLWPQAKWEDVQSTRQTHLSSLKTAFLERAKASLDYAARRASIRTQLKEARWKARLKREQLALDYSLKMQQFQQEAEEKQLEKDIQTGKVELHCAEWWKRPILRRNIAILIAVLIGFAAIPAIAALLSQKADSWIDGVRIIVEAIDSSNTNHPKLGPLQETTYYLIYYAIGVYVLLGVLRIANHLVFGHSIDPAPQDMPRILRMYQMPGAVLAMGLLLTRILQQNNSPLDEVIALGKGLITVCLVVLVVLVSVDIIDIITKQCLDPNSVLKKLFYLIFISVLDLLSNLLFGILTALNIRLIFSSLSDILFPKDDDDVQQRAHSILKKQFLKDLDNVSRGRKRAGASHRQKIWKRK